MSLIPMNLVYMLAVTRYMMTYILFRPMMLCIPFQSQIVYML